MSVRVYRIGIGAMTWLVLLPADMTTGVVADDLPLIVEQAKRHYSDSALTQYSHVECLGMAIAPFVC